MIPLNGFKKTHEDEKTATLRHEKGHEIKIAKSSLSRKLQQALKAMPMHAPEPQRLAEGGDVVEDPTKDLAPTEPTASDVKSGAPVTINISNAPAVPSAPAVAPVPAEPAVPPIAAEDPRAAAVAQLPSMQQAAEALKPPQIPVSDAALAGQEPTPADRASALAQSQPAPAAPPQNYSPPSARAPQEALAPAAAAPALRAPPPDHNQQALQHVSDVFTRERQRWEDEHRAMMEDIASSHVDPDRLWNKKSTLDKVASTIGLLLGGITGNKGLLGTYGGMIQRAIDEDVASQRLELGKKNALLDAHMKEFGNIKDASDALRMNLLTAAQAKLATAEAFHKNAEAQKTYLELDAARQQIGQHLAARRALSSASSTTPELRAKAVTFLVPDKERAAAFKELQELESAKRLGDSTLQSFDQVDHMVGAGMFSPNQRDALLQPLIAQITKDKEGRITPQDVKMIAALFPKALDSTDTRSVKRQKLSSFLTQKMVAPMLSAYGVPIPKLDMTVKAAVPAGWQ